MSDADVTRARFAASASRMAAFGDARLLAVRERLTELLELSLETRALDVGAGTGPLALALAPLVREVVGLDLVPEMLAQARERAVAYPNATFVEGDAHDLAFEAASFDVVVCGRTLHHLDGVDQVVRELARVTRPGGQVLVQDQVTWDDPDASSLQEEIERVRDPSHVRTLGDGELRELLGAAGLAVERVELDEEERHLDTFLDLAGCTGEGRGRVLELVEEAVATGRGEGLRLRRDGGSFRFTTRLGWYVARR
jgi:SAM-dependent methyltransferase